MPAYGRNQYPRTYGGGRRAQESEHRALLVALKKILNPDSDTQHYVEAYAEATGIAIVRALTARAANQAIPQRMLEVLPSWEQSLSLRPGDGIPTIARRNNVASKLRGLGNAALGDIEGAARKIIGTAFVALNQANAKIVYWPGVNPGPPGYTWASNRARIGIEIDKSQLSDLEYFALRAATFVALDAMLPSWMNFVIGTGTQFEVNTSIVGQALV